MAAVIWLIAGIALAAAEVATGDFFLLMLAGGALAAAGVTAVTDAPLWVDGIVFAVVSVGLVAGVRPSLLRRVRRGPALTTNVDALVGSRATVLERVDPHGGLVKLAGDTWTARTSDGSQVLEPGQTVLVLEIDGATAVVAEEP
ncbi:NfeD family protein [Rhodococcus sp. X156]|uniref:NfeD family protein n=1 Tax=Rhodococcus sp. X156 TaxID=2499145 RepID=UPI000FDB7FB5|nr:NfeD family protein [Rhodococcus sp. X156]